MHSAHISSTTPWSGLFSASPTTWFADEPTPLCHHESAAYTSMSNSPKNLVVQLKELGISTRSAKFALEVGRGMHVALRDGLMTPVEKRQ